MKHLIIYGDIHGCYDSLISLREKINPNQDDIEVCVGDIITKGENSIKILDYLIEHNIKSVLGNHEDKIIRYLKHTQSKKKNPIVLDEDEQTIVNNLKMQHIKYLQSMPLFLRFNDITILHGGVLNHFDLENVSKREREQILRLRYIDNNGNFVSYGKENEQSIAWSEKYDGKLGFIIYGHQWRPEIKVDKYAIGIDTGCVYGNRLSAIVFDGFVKDRYKVHSVKCKN